MSNKPRNLTIARDTIRAQKQGEWRPQGELQVIATGRISQGLTTWNLPCGQAVHRTSR